MIKRKPKKSEPEKEESEKRKPGRPKKIEKRKPKKSEPPKKNPNESTPLKSPKVKRQLPVNYIDMKYHRKNLFLHHVASPGTYQMDLMFDGKKETFQCYLMAINVNTRKLYAVNTQIKKTPRNVRDFVAIGYEWKSTEALIQALGKIITQIQQDGKTLRQIIMDGEKGMYSKKMHEFLEARGIKIRRVDLEVHTSLALIDRVIRTIRDINYKEMRGESRVITPDVMKRLLWIYNNKPHKTLSKFFKEKTTPNQLDANFEMELKWIRHVHNENFKVMYQPDFQMKKDTEVHLWEPPDKFKKRRSRLQKEIYTVVGSVGGNYLCVNKETGQEKLYPRWAMKLIELNPLEPELPNTSYRLNEYIRDRISEKDIGDINVWLYENPEE